MECEILYNIIIPLISAIIGGGLTLLGVIITIKNQEKSSKKSAIDSVKPWIFSFPRPSPNLIRELIMATSHDYNDFAPFEVFIKNTDNGIAIIEKVSTENNVYYPLFGKILDKNTKTNLCIYLGERETLNDMILHIKDVYGNTYKYKICQGNRYHYIEEITSHKKRHNHRGGKLKFTK